MGPTANPHARDCETDDVGVYFEANGHGTVLFSQAAMDAITSASTDGVSGEQRKSITHTHTHTHTHDKARPPTHHQGGVGGAPAPTRVR